MLAVHLIVEDAQGRAVVNPFPIAVVTNGSEGGRPVVAATRDRSSATSFGQSIHNGANA